MAANSFSSDTCIMCGAAVPEGRQVCPQCENLIESESCSANASGKVEKCSGRAKSSDLNLGETITYYRTQAGMTQAELARFLNITRSSVNAWEMGKAVPSVQCIIGMASLFNISTDCLLGNERTVTISADGLTKSDLKLVYSLISHLKKSRRKNA